MEGQLGSDTSAIGKAAGRRGCPQSRDPDGEAEEPRRLRPEARAPGRSPGSCPGVFSQSLCGVAGAEWAGRAVGGEAGRWAGPDPGRFMVDRAGSRGLAMVGNV